MRNSFLPVILSVLFLTVFFSCRTERQSVEAGLEKIAENHKAVGLAVVVVKDNKVVFREGFGYADLENKKPLKTDQLFRIASISKSFSATAFMQLMEEGKVSLDDDFGDLIGFPIRNPAYPDEVITLRMVLSHTSGISDRNGYFTLDVINPETNEDWASCYNEYPPGGGYEYCNLNFNMAGAVIERLTGKRFDREIDRRILSPLGLSAGYNIGDLDSSRFVKLYTFDPDSGNYKAQPGAYQNPTDEALENYELGYSTPAFSPTGGMKISADDLARYMMMHMNYGDYGSGRILKEESAKTMQTPVSETGYGLALLKTDSVIPGVTLTGHTGDAYGLHSNMYFDPEKKFGFVVITNGCEVRYDDQDNVTLSKEVVQYLYEQLIKE